MIGQTSFQNKMKVIWVVITVVLVTGVSLVILSSKIAHSQYHKSDYKNAIVMYQIHYTVFKDDDSLIGICRSAFALERYGTVLYYSTKLELDMFTDEKGYGIVLANYLIAVFMTEPKDNYDLFFQEYRRLSPELVNSPSFFRPFGAFVMKVDSDNLMQLTIDFIQEEIPLMKVDKLKASAYTLLAEAYDRIDQHDKALEMLDIANQLDP